MQHHRANRQRERHSGIPIGMRPDKLRRSRVTFRNGQNDADEGADRRDIPAGGEPRLSAALPQDRHRQVQRLLHRSRSKLTPGEMDASLACVSNLSDRAT